MDGYIPELHKKFQKLEAALKEILKEEKTAHDSFLEEKGLLIRHHSINLNKLSPEAIYRIKKQLQEIQIVEGDAKNIMKHARAELLRFDSEYEAYYHKRLDIRKRFKQYMNNAFRNARLAVVRCDDIIDIIAKKEKIHPKTADKAAMKAVESLERMTNEVLRFILLMEQLDKMISSFRSSVYYKTSRTYGRAMTKREYKKTVHNERLSSGKNPTPVFDCDQHQQDKIKKMTKDQRKTFFQAIGVESATHVIFFRTPLKPVNAESPIRQSNGLYEFKFPKGIDIEILEAA